MRWIGREDAQKPEENCLIQQVVGATMDGVFGPKTCIAVKNAWKYPLSQPEHVDGIIDDEVIQAVKKAADLDPTNRGQDTENVREKVVPACLGVSEAASPTSEQEGAEEVRDETRYKGVDLELTVNCLYKRSILLNL